MAASIINPHAFLDITVANVKLGRIVLELYKDKCPKTVDNFMSLCTGDKGNTKSGVPLHYKGCIFHRVIDNFMIQGGDFTNHDGTGGESIYGEKFEDENLELKHSRPGILSMANAGPNTNGSQFFITLTDTHHLDGKHVVFGHVVKGMGAARYIEKCVPTEGDIPTLSCKIVDCGIIPEGESFGIIDEDGTGDIYPQFPEDADFDFEKEPLEDTLKVISNIKEAGNTHHKNKKFEEALGKYQKGLCYAKHLEKLRKSSWSDEDGTKFQTLFISILLNHALCCIKTESYESAIKDCDEVLNLDPNNVKALFRRGQAHHICNDVESAMIDLERALKLEPNEKSILKEIQNINQIKKAKRDKEKQAYAKMFN